MSPPASHKFSSILVWCFLCTYPQTPKSVWFLASMNCLYCIKGTLWKQFGCLVRQLEPLCFFNSKSYLTSVSSMHLIFLSIFIGRLILPRSQKYPKAILCTTVELSWFENFAILPSKLPSVMLWASLLLWTLLPAFGGYITDFLLYKTCFWIFIGGPFSGKSLSIACEYWYILRGVAVGISYLFVPYFVIQCVKKCWQLSSHLPEFELGLLIFWILPENKYEGYSNLRFGFC